MDVARLEKQRQRFQDLLNSYKDLCAQEKDIESTKKSLEERGATVRTESSRLQGAMAILREDIQEMEAEQAAQAGQAAQVVHGMEAQIE